MTIELDRKRSVTRDDSIPVGDGGVWMWQVYDAGRGQSAPGLPAHWSMARDVVLSSTLFLAEGWATAVKTAMNQVVGRKFTIKDSADSARRTERSQSLLLDMGGPVMYTEELEKVYQDYALTDNGGFIEIARETKNPKSKPVGLYHLDSLRCYPTGDREYPYRYIDRMGVWHNLHAANVIRLVDQSSPRMFAWGVGLCAASVAWRHIVLEAAITTYLTEKITGSRALALHFVKGVSPAKMDTALTTADADSQRRGNVIYKGAIVIPVLDDVQVATIDLASIPDGFDADKLMQQRAMVYALALGMPYTDIATLTGGQFGTGTQSQVIDESRKGRGVEKFITLLERKLNYLVMPRATTVDFFGIDPRDQLVEAQVQNAQGMYVKTLTESGIITPQQAANYLADGGWLPPEFAPQDATAGGVLTDSGEHSKRPDAMQAALDQVQGLLSAAPPPPPATKAARVLAPSAMLVDDDVIRAANELRREVAE